jgi:5-methylcytosine-specific restriction enzyme subunit McrC
VTAQVLGLSEWSSWTALPGSLTRDDQRLVDALEAGGETSARLDVRERFGRVEVRTRSWVGRVRIANTEIIIRPKLAGLEPGLIQMLEVVGGLQRLSRLPSERTLAIGASGGLFDLLAILLADEIARLIREGLNLGYDAREEDLRVLRGRLSIKDQALRHFGKVERLACRFDELDNRTPENELLLLALAAAARVSLAPETRSLVRRVLTELTDQLGPDAEPRPEALLRRLVPPWEPDSNRQLSRYRNAVELAWLILEHQLVERPLTEGAVRSFAFLMDMNVLFERYLTHWLGSKLRAHGLRVSAQASHLALRDLASGHTLGAIRPDILVSRNGSRPIAVDAKYKRYAGRDELARPHPPMSDLTQALLYAQVYGGPVSPRRTLLVFPVETANPERRSLELRDSAGPGDRCMVQVMPFPLARALESQPDLRLDDLVRTASQPLLLATSTS